MRDHPEHSLQVQFLPLTRASHHHDTWGRKEAGNRGDGPHAQSGVNPGHLPRFPLAKGEGMNALEGRTKKEWKGREIKEQENGKRQPGLLPASTGLKPNDWAQVQLTSISKSQRGRSRAVSEPPSSRVTTQETKSLAGTVPRPLGFQPHEGTERPFWG